MGAFELTKIDTTAGGDSWASPHSGFDGDYLEWLKENCGQSLMVLVRRVGSNIVDRDDVKIVGENRVEFEDFFEQKLEEHLKALRESGLERIPETGSLF